MPVIRRAQESDRQDWLRLWQGYNEFYQRIVEDRVTDRTWDAVLCNNGQPFAFLAELDDRVVGFAHYFFVPSTSDWAPRCYMQDLFTDPAARGQGIGRGLITAVYAAADEQDAAQTYWLTASENRDARQLYDRVATQSPFIKYQR